MSDSVEHGPEGPNVDRRSFLGIVSVAITGVIAACGAVVALAYVTGPAMRSGRGTDGATGEWSPVPDAKAPPADGPKKYPVTVVADAGWAKSQATHAVFLDAAASGAAIAFSARCPHEGCQVDWRAEAKQYVCPCHNSVWSREGERVGGPTKRGLDPLDVRQGQSGLEVRYETFALDTPDRVPVG
jgi:Rieske Fe-S protein